MRRKLGPKPRFASAMRSDGRAREPVDSGTGAQAVNTAHGGFAISPRGDMPKYRVPFSLRGRSHVILHHDISRQAFPPDRHGEHACADRRPHRRGFRRRPAADSRRGQAPPRGRRRLGRASSPAARPSSSASTAQKLAQGTAAWLRHADVAAETLEGGFEGWKAAKLPLVPAAKLPPRDAQGRTVWVTRARPKIDRIACPWLIRRFVDPERGVPVRGAVRGDRGRRALRRRCPSTSRTCSGAIAASSAPSTSWSRSSVSRRRRCCGWRPWCAAPIPRGSISRRKRPACSRPRSACRGCIDDDLEQLEAGMMLYDAFYRWCRDATGETHNWPTNKAKP